MALKLYDDDDVADGIALLDNWGLMHILFHDSPVLWPRSHGWTLRPERALSELAPAPAFANLWRQAPAAILDLLRGARCRPVRQWALFFLRQDPTLLDRAELDVLLELLQSTEPEIVALAARALEIRPGLESISAERWLRLLETAPPTALDAVCSLVRSRLHATSLTLEQNVRLACRRPLPVARLGFDWLKQRSLADSDGPCCCVWRTPRPKPCGEWFAGRAVVSPWPIFRRNGFWNFLTAGTPVCARPKAGRGWRKICAFTTTCRFGSGCSSRRTTMSA